MHNDIEFWTNLKPPASPSDKDKEIYASLIKGRVLLLGSTKKLLDIADEAWDLNPKYPDMGIVDRDWMSLDQHFNTIIADGAINFPEEQSRQLLEVVSQHCDRFVVRTFYKPNWPTKYAKWFPNPEHFYHMPRVVAPNNVYRFFVWDFNE